MAQFNRFTHAHAETQPPTRGRFELGRLYGLAALGVLAATIPGTPGCSAETFGNCLASRSCDDTEPPTVLTVAPGDGDVDVEREIAITAVFSEPIDASTVTTSSVTLTGPDGDVDGTLSVDDAAISFTPNRPLYLLGDYALALHETIKDLAGNTLAESTSVEFRVRDGRWSKPTHPFGRTVPSRVSRFEHNALGDAVLGFESVPEGRVDSALYDAEANLWSQLTELRAIAGVEYHPCALGIDDSRRAVVTWGVASGGAADFGWSRFTNEDGWTSAGALPQCGAPLAVTSDGIATAVCSDGDGNRLTRSVDLVNGTVHEAVSAPPSEHSPQLISSKDRMALLTVNPIASAYELAVAWKVGSDWGAPESLATVSQQVNVLTDSDENGDILVVWHDDQRLWSRVYDARTASWEPATSITTTTSDTILMATDFAAGRAAVVFRSFDPDPATWVAIREPDVGWVEGSVVRLDGEAAWHSLVGIAIDRLGNAVATWSPEGTTFNSRRYVASTGWQPETSFSAKLDRSTTWAATARDGTVLAVSNDNENINAPVPWAVRFE